MQWQRELPNLRRDGLGAVSHDWSGCSFISFIPDSTFLLCPHAILNWRYLLLMSQFVEMGWICQGCLFTLPHKSEALIHAALSLDRTVNFCTLPFLRRIWLSSNTDTLASPLLPSQNLKMCKLCLTELLHLVVLVSEMFCSRFSPLLAFLPGRNAVHYKHLHGVPVPENLISMEMVYLLLINAFMSSSLCCLFL